MRCSGNIVSASLPTEGPAELFGELVGVQRVQIGGADGIVDLPFRVLNRSNHDRPPTHRWEVASTTRAGARSRSRHLDLASLRLRTKRFSWPFGPQVTGACCKCQNLIASRAPR